MPDSPISSTDASVPATRPIASYIVCITGERPSILPKRPSRCSSERSAAISSCSTPVRGTRAKMLFSRCMFSGFTR